MTDERDIAREFWGALERGNHDAAKELAETEPRLVLTRDASERTPLHYLALNGGDDEAARWFVERGVDLNAADEEGKTALHYLTDAEDAIEMAQALLDCGADPNVADGEGATPLLIAARQVPGPNNYTDLLLEYGALPDLYSAVVLGREQDLRALLSEKLRVLHESPYRPRLFHDAIRSDIPNKHEIIKTLVEYGLDPNEHPSGFHPPLVMAAALGDEALPIVETLIAHGADVNGRDANDQSILTSIKAAGANLPTINAFLKAGAEE